MFRIIKQVLIALLNFGGSLASKCVSLDNNFSNFNPVELNFYPFMISLDKCSWCCNSVNNLSKTCAFRVKQKTQMMTFIPFLHKCTHLENFFHHMKKLNQNIKFTLKEDINRELAFPTSVWYFTETE